MEPMIEPIRGTINRITFNMLTKPLDRLFEKWSIAKAITKKNTKNPMFHLERTTSTKVILKTRQRLFMNVFF